MAESVSNPFSVSNRQRLRFFGDEWLELERFVNNLSDTYVDLIYGAESNERVAWFNQVGAQGYEDYLRFTINEWAKARDYFNRTGKLPRNTNIPEEPRGEHYK